jgi:NAD(P)-dependent dehydrogenase (short-subunit alcohol dehydrogenase family)
MIRCKDGVLASTLNTLALPDDALIFVADPDVTDDWSAVSNELTEAFELSQAAARSNGSVVYVVAGDDLLGRNGPGRAMVACGLLSAARTLALETARSGVPVNVVAVGSATSVDLTGLWVDTLCRPNGPNGELIRLGVDHLGKALP